ncbi:MAG: response regulator transcription factor [Bacteriovoracaceae bacterium]
MNKTILIVDDNKNFVRALKSSLIERGFEVLTAFNIIEAEQVAKENEPEFCIVDLKMPGESGLKLIPRLLEIDPETNIVILTGYAHVETAIEAIKLGATHYLSKPVEVDEILEAFNKKEGNPDANLHDTVASLDDVEKEHILSVLKKNNNNITATARELKLHRRTLQRKLGKI